MANIFISYHREDSDFSELLQVRLKKAGHTPKVDLDILNAGEDWRDKLDLEIRQCKVLILVISADSAASEYVNYEWAFALGAGLIIIPVELESTEIHPRLTPLQRLNFTNKARPWQTLYDQLDNLLCADPDTGISIPVNASPTIKRAINALDSLHTNEQIAAVETLSQIDDPQAKKLLIKALNHPVKTVRISAAEKFPDQNDPVILPALFEAYNNEFRNGIYKLDSEMEREWVWKLTSFGKLATPHFIELLKNSDLEAQSFALRCLKEIGDSSATNAVSQLLASTEEYIRMTAVNTLSKIGDTSIVPRLHELLDDDSDDVRAATIDAMGDLNDNTASSLFIDYIEHEPSKIRAASARALGKIGEQSALPSLISLLEDTESYETRCAAVEALGKIGNKSAIAAIKKIFSPKDLGSEFVNEIATALLRLKDLESLPEITKGIISYRSGTGPADAIIELGNLSDAGETALLSILNNSDNGWTQHWCIETLKNINSEKSREAIKCWRRTQ